MNINAIVFTHAVVCTNKSATNAKKTGEVAVVYLIAGPGDENSIAVGYGKIGDGPLGMLLPTLSMKPGTLPKDAEKTVVFRGSILSGLNTFCEFAIQKIREKYGKMKCGKKYRVSISGEVELVEDPKPEDYKT